MKLTLFQVDLDPTYNPHLLLQQGGTEHHEFQVLFVLISFLNSFLPQISICLDPMIYVPRRHWHNIWQGASKSKPIDGKQLLNSETWQQNESKCIVVSFCLASRREKKCFRTKSLTLLRLLETSGHAF